MTLHKIARMVAGLRERVGARSATHAVKLLLSFPTHVLSHSLSKHRATLCQQRGSEGVFFEVRTRRNCFGSRTLRRFRGRKVMDEIQGEGKGTKWNRPEVIT